jgi:hypothetical protein
MRQILIAKNETISTTVGDEVVLLSDLTRDSVLSTAFISFFDLPLKLDLLSGGKVKLIFTLHRDLAFKEIYLLGAYLDNDVVRAAFKNLSDVDLYLAPGTPLLTATLIETVSYRQIDLDVRGNMTIKKDGGKSIKVEPKSSKKKGKK